MTYRNEVELVGYVDCIYSRRRYKGTFTFGLGDSGVAVTILEATDDVIAQIKDFHRDQGTKVRVTGRLGRAGRRPTVICDELTFDVDDEPMNHAVIVGEIHQYLNDHSAVHLADPGAFKASLAAALSGGEMPFVSSVDPTVYTAAWKPRPSGQDELADQQEALLSDPLVEWVHIEGTVEAFNFSGDMSDEKIGSVLVADSIENLQAEL